ncbi:MAG: hypothetical protein MRY59_00480 [Aquisalinus sp.]|nr:hypothetical protein [Aquisalinus sp.]
MTDTSETPEKEDAPKPKAAFNVGAFMLAFLFVWIVFDNMALGLLVGLFAAGGSHAAQTAAGKNAEKG